MGEPQVDEVISAFDQLIEAARDVLVYADRRLVVERMAALRAALGAVDRLDLRGRLLTEPARAREGGRGASPADQDPRSA